MCLKVIKMKWEYVEEIGYIGLKEVCMIFEKEVYIVCECDFRKRGQWFQVIYIKISEKVFLGVRI